MCLLPISHPGAASGSLLEKPELHPVGIDVDDDSSSGLPGMSPSVWKGTVKKELGESQWGWIEEGVLVLNILAGPEESKNVRW